MPEIFNPEGVLWIRGGRILDPARDLDLVADIGVAGGKIVETIPLGGADPVVLDAKGLWVLPGLMDLHVHLREPGGEEAETVASGCRAAVHGGFVAVGVMPNTTPPMDSPAEVRALLERGRTAGYARVVPCACLTVGRAGRRVADLEALAEAGARAFTDDGTTPADSLVLQSAMELAASLGRPVLDHTLDPSAKGHLHAGSRAVALGIEGIPSEVEIRMVERDIELARQTGCRLHIQHVSTREAVRLIRTARRAGLPVTGEATPHHLALCDEDIPGPDARFKMSPPLRTAADREALREAVADGTLTVLASDHAPHTMKSKQQPFEQAPNGVVGLETALGVTASILLGGGWMRPLDWVTRWCVGPADVLGLPRPSLVLGSEADLVVFDPDLEWTVSSAHFVSRSRNTPFEGWRLKGKAVLTLVGGRVCFADSAVFDRIGRTR